MNKSQTHTVKYFNDTQIQDLWSFLSSISTSEKQSFSTDEFLKLESIYSDSKFEEVSHHYYANIYSVVSQVQATDGHSIEYLAANLGKLKNTYVKQSIDITNEIYKLCDYTNLEIERLSDSLRNQNELKSYKINLEQQRAETDKKYKSLTKTSEEISQKLEKSRIDYIAILGIFASVILAFVGTFTFSTSVLSNINSVSIYRLVFVAGIIGLVFFDTIFTLLQYITNFPKSIFAWITFIVFNSIFFMILILTPIIYCHNNKSPEPVPQVINIFEPVQDE